MDVLKKQLNEFLLSVPDTPPVRGYTLLIRILSYAGARTKKHLLHGVVIKYGFIEDQRNPT